MNCESRREINVGCQKVNSAWALWCRALLPGLCMVEVMAEEQAPEWGISWAELV